MRNAQSKITAQNEVSVPATIRKKLGLGPGSVLELCEQDDKVFVRRAARYSFEDVHKVLFKSAPEPTSPSDMDESIRGRMRRKYARR